MENKQIFEVGDRVFDYFMGWGEVVEVLEHYKYPIFVRFKLGSSAFTRDGRLDEKYEPTLSFTEYNLVTGGFSQERQEPLLKRGDIVWVRDKIDQSWVISHFVKKQDGLYVVSDDTIVGHSALGWKYLTTRNPYQNS